MYLEFADFVPSFFITLKTGTKTASSTYIKETTSNQY